MVKKDKYADFSINQNIDKKRDILYEVFNKHYLRIVKKKDGESKEYTIDLISLTPNSMNRVKKPWYWIALGLVCLVASGLFIVGFLDSLDMVRGLLNAGLALCCLAASGGCIYMFVKKTLRHQVFVTYFAHFPLVELICDNPDKTDFERFFKGVEDRIRLIREDYRMISKDDLKAGELKMLRRLKEKGVISKADYEHVKEKIFGLTTSGKADDADEVDEVNVEKA
jgi:hypothetical protein